MEIYFRDLNKEAQKRFLKEMGLKNEKEGNYDVFPITEISDSFNIENTQTNIVDEMKNDNTFLQSCYDKWDKKCIIDDILNYFEENEYDCKKTYLGLTYDDWKNMNVDETNAGCALSYIINRRDDWRMDNCSISELLSNIKGDKHLESMLKIAKGNIKSEKDSNNKKDRSYYR